MKLRVAADAVRKPLEAETCQQERRAQLAEVLWATTLDKLAVANPAYRDESAEP